MGTITNIYLKPLAIHRSCYVRGTTSDFGTFDKIVIKPQGTFVWEGFDCNISCDNPDHPDYYQNLSPEVKSNTYLPGAKLSTLGIKDAKPDYIIHSGVP